MKIQNIFNFGLILLISAALMLSGCQKSEDSSTSTGESGGGSSDPVSEVVTALQGAVKTFGSSSSGRSAASTGSSVAVDQGVKSLVSLYLLIDTDYKYPVAKVKSASDGSYSFNVNDAKDFLTDTDTHSNVADDYGYNMPCSTATLECFQSLGPLTVRAIYVSNGKAKAITAMADPAKPDEDVRVDPIVSRVAQQVIGKLVETIKSAIDSMDFLGGDAKKAILSSVLDAVQTAVNDALEEVASVTTFEVPEGTTFDEENPDAILEVEMNQDALDELQSVIASDSSSVDIEDSKVAVADSGKLGDTLSDEDKGAFDKLAEGASSTATDVVSSGDASMSESDKSKLKLKAKSIKVEGLRKFFLTLGFPVVLDNKSDNTSIVAVSLKVPSSVSDQNLPGKATFGDRSIRHFLIKGNSSSTAPSGWESAPELSDQIDDLLTDLGDRVSNGVVDESALSDNQSMLDRVRTFHRFGKTLSEGMPLVSSELVNWMADYDNKTVTVQDVAVQIAKITEWQQERIVFAEGLPIFTGQFSAPSSGGTVKASELVTAMTRPLKKDAKTTVPELTDNNENFWAPFAAQALAEQIMRNADQIGAQNSTFDFGDVLPKTKDDYKKFLKGVEYTNASGNSTSVPPSPAFIDARSTIAKGLVAALPDSAYSTDNQTKTLNGETKLSAKASVFIITYLLELQFPVEKAKGLMSDDGGGLFPNIENFKKLNFTQEVGVADVAAQVMAVTGPEEGDGFNFAQNSLRSGTLLQGTSATNGLADLMLPEFKVFDAGDLNLSTNTTTTVECPVKMYDGSSLPSDLSVTLLKFDGSTGEFSEATKTDNTTTISFPVPNNNTYSVGEVPTNQGYAIKFKISSYRNDLPMIHFWADEFSNSINACGEEGFVIGPDVEDQKTPGMGLFASEKKSSAEGIDFSNFTEAGKMFLLFPSDEPSQGTRDLMLTGTPGGSFSLEVGTNMSIAALKKTSSGDFSLSSGDNITGINSVMGQGLQAVLGEKFNGTSKISISPDSYGGLSQQVLLLQVSDKEYWLIELRFIDTLIGMLDLGFAKVSPQGRAEIPEAAFEKGPVDMEKAGSIQNYHLSYGDGLKMDEQGNVNIEFSVGFDGSVEDIDTKVTMRYAGDDFLENIDDFSDLESYFSDASKISKIPVRLDGRGTVNFVKLSYDKQKKSYTMSSESSSATNLKHNDLIGVCLSGDWQNDEDSCPDYILRVVRNAPEGDLMANLNLEVELIQFTDPGEGEDYRKAVIGPKSLCDSCPTLEMSSSGGESEGGEMVVFDLDKDGIPWIFDPNDDDMGTGHGMDIGFGLSINLVNKYSYDGDDGGQIKQNDGEDEYSTRLLVETKDVYLGDVEKITLTNEALGMNGAVLATCTPPSMSGSTFTEASCSVTDDISSGLKSAPSLVYQSYDGVGIFITPTSSALSSLNGKEIGFKILFRTPVDLEGNPFKCGEQDCPGMPPVEGKVKLRIPSSPVGGFENVKIASGNDSAKNQADVSSVDSGKKITVTSSAVSNANEYELKIFCDGFENSQMSYFEPPYSMNYMLPRGTTSPLFTIEPGMIPSGGGRLCQFRMVAKGEDSVGNSIGATMHKFDLTLTGGFSGPGGFVDNSIKVKDRDKVCWSEGDMPKVSDNCDNQITLFVASITDDVLSLEKNENLTYESGSQIEYLGYGILEGSLYVGGENNCIKIEGDYFMDSSSCNAIDRILSWDKDTGLSKGGSVTVKNFEGNIITDTDLSSLDGYNELVVESGDNKYRIFLNINQFGNEKEASVSVEKESGSNTGNLGSGDRFNVKASESQFFEFGVLFIKGGEAKLE
ncbi:MAG: hypothetical protein VW993_10200, partial [Deltaproteobacteria bacterium]